jgi:hypothetical protein
MSLPITAKVQQMTQGGLKTTKPVLGDKSCGCKQPCDCGSPNKYAAKNKGQQSLINSGPKGVKAAKAMGVTAQQDGSALPKKSCGYKK